MTQSSKKNRIIFIDLMRAFAVLQMVQGHTVDLVLADSYRNLNYPLYAAWLFMRGMTAPIFLFSSGVVFTYLFRLHDEPFFSNPRTMKGFKRFILLVVLGYLLRYPTPTIIDFSGVTEGQWKIFLSVDVLQLIGFGLLFLLIFSWLAEKIKLSDHLVYSFFAILFFYLYTIFEYIEWKEYLPVAVAAYFYKGTGSLFPLFPAVGYVLFGGVLGSYLAKNPMAFKTTRFSMQLAAAGIILILLSYLLDFINLALYGSRYDYNVSVSISFFRLGFVILLNSVVCFISIKIHSIPTFIILIGRNTLLIYVVHLMILFGSAWNPGLSLLYANSLDVWETVSIAGAMVLAMAGMVWIIYKFKIRNKEVVS